jgi:hypothetical protein
LWGWQRDFEDEMKKDSQEKRIADLERRVRELEAQPREIHYHPPVYVQPYIPPSSPMPEFGRPWVGDPIPPYTPIAWGSNTIGGGGTGNFC